MPLTKVTPQTKTPEVDRPISAYPDYGTRVTKSSITANVGFVLADENLVRKNFVIANETNAAFYVKFGDQMCTSDDWSINIPAMSGATVFHYEPDTYVSPAKITGIGAGTGNVRITEMS